MFSIAAIGNTIANSRFAQAMIGGGLLILGFLVWLARHDRAVVRNHEIRAERRTRKEQDQVRETLNEKSVQARAARAAVQPVDSASELPDALAAILIRD